MEIVLGSQAIPWKERVADDGVGCIICIHFEAVDIDFFEAQVLLSAAIDEMYLHDQPQSFLSP